MTHSLDHVRIVLVEPAGALNVGSVARVMANMGLSRLVLVAPHCDPLGEEALRMAVHAAEILHQAQRVPDLPAALRGCQRAIATTARPRAEMALDYPEHTLPWLLAPDSVDPIDTALIFGPEDRGLSNQELSYAQRYVKIPSDPAYPALNLAQAVAVCSYVLRRSAQVVDHPGQIQMSEKMPKISDAGRISHTKSSTHNLVDAEVDTKVDVSAEVDTEVDTKVNTKVNTEVEAEVGIPPLSPPAPPADLAQVDGYFQNLEAVLLKIGYLYPHTVSSRMQKMRRLLSKAQPSAQEVAMLRGMLRQVEWAIDQARSDIRSDIPDSID